MYMNKKSLWLESGAYFIASAVVSIFGFIISILYSQFFSASEYGVYALVFSMYSLITSIYSGWLKNAIIRNAELYSGKNDIFYGTVFILHIIMSIIYCFSLFCFFFFINVDTLYKNIFYLFGIIYIFEYFIIFFNLKMRTSKNIKQYNLNSILLSFYKIIIFIILYILFDMHSVMVIPISILISELLLSISMFFKYKVYKLFKISNFDYIVIKKLFIFGIPLMGTAVTTWILAVSDRYLINIFYGETAAGLYSYSYQLGSSLFILLTQFIMLGAYTTITRTWQNQGKEKTENLISDYLKIYLTLTIPACIGVVLTGKDIFSCIIGKSYFDSYPVFIITCVSIFILGLTQYSNKPYELTNKTNKLLIMNILTAIINILLNLLLIPFMGYQLAAWTTLVSYLFLFIISYYKGKNILRIKIDMLSLKKIILSSVFMSIVIIIIKLSVQKITILSLIIEISIGSLIYLLSLVITREIKIKDIIKRVR